ncbi:hypothetical protein LF41_1733 [Lysobacter dokdonensis DS-58]|uniref:Uncharacterized protein n=1 Tax=Lysobacter dokdonensis DS-58 TaxID=1300345 RepID=A0A0A2WXX2_9GAMM|nr:hypothetical protein LF41_1733 [Lysobacter dokdonensis DS-58]
MYAITGIDSASDRPFSIVIRVFHGIFLGQNQCLGRRGCRIR